MQRGGILESIRDERVDDESRAGGYSAQQMQEKYNADPRPVVDMILDDALLR